MSATDPDEIIPKKKNDNGPNSSSNNKREWGKVEAQERAASSMEITMGIAPMIAVL